ncbi:MAG TPA: hypothetical protein VKF84_09925 [Candidatus Sulfotelmatobacter sp.]|nr:hypothetical protein [Candidatus Sulfotelmatobacter sp.]
MMLRDYFEPAGQQRALEEYGKFARAKGWDIEEKMRLYRASARAFDPTRPDSEAFDEIYRILCGWQVFRGACMSACWSSRETFDRIRKEFCEFAWGGPVSLLSLAGRGKEETLLSRLESVRGIKPNAGYPVMAVSKFLHAYNPSLFPIYDNEVIWERVFRRFKNEFKEFCWSSKLDYDIGFTPLFLRNYVSWSSSIVSSAHSKFMEIFVDWLVKQPSGQMPGDFDPLNLYATAFEFTVIGAAEAEKSSTLAA